MDLSSQSAEVLVISLQSDIEALNTSTRAPPVTLPLDLVVLLSLTQPVVGVGIPEGTGTWLTIWFRKLRCRKMRSKQWKL